jgi:uncharacterized protein (TIGR03437 family)
MKNASVIALAIACCLTASAQISNIIVTSAASFQRGLPTKGSISTIFCTGISVQGVVAADKLPLPTTLAGVTVKVGGAAAPLFAVAELGGYQQVNFQVPQAAVIDSDSNTSIDVAQNGARGSVTVVYGANATGDFFLLPGTGIGIFQHAKDYSVVTVTNPALPGETIIAYLTGMPPAVPIVPDGQPAPDNPLSVIPQINTEQEIDEVLLYVGDTIPWPDPTLNMGFLTRPSCPISFLGLSPGSVGLYQINFVLPSGTFPGYRPAQIVRRRCKAFAPFNPKCGLSALYNRFDVSAPVNLPVIQVR